ncbi:MAG: hypothetical protein JW822_12425 [Spirochaetales bacterium]|nr:hypothetical protein [Spirochaetales bacterium]
MRIYEKKINHTITGIILLDNTPFVKASIYYLYTHADSSGTISEYATFNVMPEADINLFLNNNMALAASIYFSYTNRTLLDSSPESGFASWAYGLSLGANVFL